MAQAQAYTLVGRQWSDDAYRAKEAEDCIVVDTSTFEATEAGQPDLMEPSEEVALQEDVCYLETLEDEDIITANDASVAQDTFEKATQTTLSASTGAFDAIQSDGFSPQSHETCSDPRNAELQMRPQFQDSTSPRLIMKGMQAASNSAKESTRENHRPLQPLPTVPLSEPKLYNPPAVTFTIENGIKTSLSPTEIELFFRIFLANTRLLLRSRQTPDKVVLYAMEALMTQTSTDFYKWYTVESQAAAKVSVLAFTLLDSQWCDGAILVPGGNLRDFRLLKQAIWDSFWLTFSLKSPPTPFHVYASHLPDKVLAYGAVSPAPETTASTRIVASAISNTSGVSSSIQQPRPAHTGRKSNIYHLLNHVDS
jgi:hypothetical protein